jgi:anti-sigma-K factor RskA
MNDQGNREELMESVALYALGVLPREDAALIAAFVASDLEARREYLDLRAAADALAHSAEDPVDSATSSRMKERLLARVRAEAAGSGAARSRAQAAYPTWLWGTGLAAAAAIVFSVVSVAQDVNLRGELAAAQRRIGTLQAQNGQSERVAAQDRRTLTDLLALDAKRYTVAAGTVVVRRDRIYFAFSKLPPPPKGHVYQAWTAPKGSTTVAPSITFAPNADGVAVVALPVDATRVGAVAVSVEPDGGSKAPTTTPTFIKPLT